MCNNAIIFIVSIYMSSIYGLFFLFNRFVQFLFYVNVGLLIRKILDIYIVRNCVN
jgi:hypothetical protein